MSVKSEKTAEPEEQRWKQKYYNHLDLLDKKTSDWQTLESILKKAVLRLSIAAEGQHVYGPASSPYPFDDEETG